MFVSKKYDKSRGRWQVQILRSVRTAKGPRQKLVRSIGSTRHEEDVEGMVAHGEQVKARLLSETNQVEIFQPKEYDAMVLKMQLDRKRSKAEQHRKLGVDLGECCEIARPSIGMRETMGAIYAELGWNRLLGGRRPAGNRILKEMVLARLSEPVSKRATVERLVKHAGISLNLDQVYDTMDYVDDAIIDQVCRQAHNAAADLCGGKIDVLFYDCTTLAFTTEREDAEEAPDRLLAKGYSKDGKSHRSQVLLALMVTAEGLPVGYHLFPGNMWEGHTLEFALKDLSTRCELGEVTLVADAGMLSKENLALLAEHKVSNLVGYRLRSAGKAIQKKVLDWRGFVSWSGKRTKSQVLQHGGYKVIKLNDDSRLIVTYAPDRARRDAHKRDKKLDKLMRKLDQSRKPASVSRSGDARYLRFKGGEIELDPGKVKTDAQWDGLHAIQVTGNKKMSAEDCVSHYRQLWQIESCFRTNKHDLKVRPVYHWTARRVRAHIAICFMAFCCLQHVRQRLKVIGHPMSPDWIRRELNSLQWSILHRVGTDEEYVMPSSSTVDARRILRTVGLYWNRIPFQKSPRKERKTRQAAKAEAAKAASA